MTSINNIKRLSAVFSIAAITIMVGSGCTEKTEDASTTPPPATGASANVPASVANEAQNKQKAGQDMGNDAAARADAYNAAKAAYEAKQK